MLHRTGTNYVHKNEVRMHLLVEGKVAAEEFVPEVVLLGLRKERYDEH